MKKFSLLFLATMLSVFANAQKTYTDAHPKNYRSWNLGIHAHNTFFFGDLQSFEYEKNSNIDAGGVEIGGGLSLAKWVAPSIGLQFNFDYNNLSGSKGVQYFEGNQMTGGLDLLVNLSNMFVQGLTQDRRSALLGGIGLGWSSSESIRYDITGKQLARTGVVDAAGKRVDPPKRSNQPYYNLLLQYKYRISNGLDLDLGVRHNILPEDWLDVYESGRSTDQWTNVFVGLSYNFGAKEKVSVVYSNPLDKMYADMEEVKNNFDQLTTDDDKDGVNNYFDKDNSTPEGVAVNGNGEATDVDMDGVPDYMDEDPFTSKGAKVTANGRAVDSDGDGVPDHMDEEPNTPKGTLVNFKGKSIPTGGGMGSGFMPSVYFAFNSANVSAANYERLATVAMVMKNNPNVKVKIVGHADSRGSEEYNKNLSMRRAKAVVEVLVKTYGIDEGRFTTEADGEDQPLATGRYDVNRRADIMPQ